MVKVFISYSRKDAKYRDKLLVHLANLRRQDRVQIWSDQEIETGTEWEKEIWEHFNTSQVVVLLISADFIASDFCFGKEFKAAMDGYRAGRVALVPVIVRSCHRKGSAIESLQCLFVDKPAAAYTHQDEPWTKVAEEIEKKVSRIASMTLSRAITALDRQEGDELRYLCNRQSQEMSFTMRFTAQAPEVPQIYYLPGPDNAAHAGFTRRIRFRTLPALLDRPEESLRDIVLPVAAPWVQTPPTGKELGYLLDQLAYTLKKFHAAGGATAAEMKVDTKLAGRLLLVEHVVYAKYWNDAMAALLKAYVQFWARAEPAPPGPRLIVFFQIVFPARDLRDAGEKEKARNDSILARLDEIAAELDGKGCTVTRLEPLSCVEREHVQDWISYHAGARSDADSFVDRLFPGEECLPMKQVEKELANSLNLA